MPATPKTHDPFTSAFVDARRVDVWLPPGYEAGPPRRFPVVYMHDGQNLFDAELAFAGVAWGVDAAMTRLIAQGEIREALIVGVWNTPQRFQEYLPQKVMAQGEATFGEQGPVVPRDPILSDRYLQFLVAELKPFIDATYHTLPNRDNTFIMGSSMGGLISAYALCEYPNTFGGAGCVSTHWPAVAGSIIGYLERHLPDPATHKLYFDYGTETVDALYEPYQQQVDDVMRRRGYSEGANWMTRKFVGAEHSERAWSQRVDIPITFFLAQ